MYIRNAPPVLDIKTDGDALHIEKSTYARQRTPLSRSILFVRVMIVTLVMAIIAFVDVLGRHGWDAFANEATGPYTSSIFIAPLFIPIITAIYVNSAKKTAGWSLVPLPKHIVLRPTSYWKGFSKAKMLIPHPISLFIGRMREEDPQDIYSSLSIYLNRKNETIINLDIQDSLFEAHDICTQISSHIPNADYQNGIISPLTNELAMNEPSASSPSGESASDFVLPQPYKGPEVVAALFGGALSFALAGGAFVVIYALAINPSISLTNISPLIPVTTILMYGSLIGAALYFMTKHAFAGLPAAFGTRTLTVHSDGVEFTERGPKKVQQHCRVSFDEVTEVFINRGRLGELFGMGEDVHLVVRWGKASFAVVGDGMSVEELQKLHTTIEQARHAYLQDRLLAEPA